MAARPQITIVGAGLMGSGIAASAALAGHPVKLYDTAAGKAANAATAAASHLRQLAAGGLASEAEAARAAARIACDADLPHALAGAFWVIEAITENLPAKQALFRDIERHIAPEVLLTSNTSGLRISEIAAGLRHPERAATTHFWFPGHLVPLVEVVMGEGTREETATELRRVLLSWGKAPVIVRRDLPGQLANRILQAIIREASAIVDSGLASAADVDTSVKLGMGLRFPAWGPLEHVDTVGIDLCLSVQDTVLPSLYNEPRATPLMRKLADEGRKGVAAGQGFHDWTRRDHAALVAERDRFLLNALRLLGLGRPPSAGEEAPASDLAEA